MARGALGCVPLLWLACVGCYLSHEPAIEAVPGCAPPGRGEHRLSAAATDFGVPIASDGCDLVAAAWIEPEPPLRRLRVDVSRDAGRRWSPAFDEALAGLTAYELLIDDRGAPTLLTREEQRLLVRRLEGDRLGTELALHVGERIGLGGEGGVYRPPMRGDGAPPVVAYWAWDGPEGGAVLVARLQAAPVVRRVADRGLWSVACGAADGSIVVGWSETDGGAIVRTHVAVAADIDAPFEAHVLGASSALRSTVDVACSHGGVLAAWVDDGGVALARLERGAWVEVARWPGPVRYPVLWPGRERTLLTFRQDDALSLVTLDAAGGPLAAPAPLPPGWVTRGACDVDGGHLLLAHSEPEGVAALFHVDLAGSVREEERLEDVGADLRLRCDRPDRVLVSFTRDDGRGGPWIAQRPR